MLSLLRLERKQKSSSNSFRIRIFLFLSYSFGIERISYPENHTRFQTELGKVNTREGPKTIPFRAAHTFMAYIREYPPGGGGAMYPGRIVRAQPQSMWQVNRSFS